MSDEATTRRVTPAELKENFELRDEIKQLRLLIAGIIRYHGGRMSVSKRALDSISYRDTFTQEEDRVNRCIVLTFEGKP